MFIYNVILSICITNMHIFSISCTSINTHNLVVHLYIYIYSGCRLCINKTNKCFNAQEAKNLHQDEYLKQHIELIE